VLPQSKLLSYKIFRRLVFAFTAVVAGLPLTAEAQIYAWRAENGTLVLSDRPLNPEARTYAVSSSTSVRTTRRPVAANVYDDLVTRNAEREGVRAELVRAVIQAESGFNRFAVSPKGAMGLMQLMPRTATELGVTNPFDAAQNIRGGVAYLRSLLQRYQGNEELALAAYNAGPGAVARYGGTVPPYKETRRYVQKIRGTTASAPVISANRIYKSVGDADGRQVPSYSNVKPAGVYEVVK